MKTINILTIATLVPFTFSGAALAAEENLKPFWQGRQNKRQEFRTQLREENRSFRQSLKDKSPEEKKAAMLQHRQDIAAKREAFHTQNHTESMEALKAKLARNTRLTDAQKNELLDYYEKQYQGNSDFYAKQAAGNHAFFEKIANDSTLTQAQRKEAIRQHFAERRQENKDYRQSQKEARKNFFSRLKPSAQTAQKSG